MSAAFSILGTTGIVHPYSTAAFGLAWCKAGSGGQSGQTSVVLTTGGRTEKFVMRECPSWMKAVSCKWVIS
ncbi:cobalt-precorrin-5B (C(1))-methyltransferase [Methylomonas denitrificans]|uniref:cobalt-precorrin-5B (C(1))-methyltransferase n=1 Tax=Methylomonas denitrificans TaxID=1538553 RepID=UPI002FFBAC4E